MDEDALIERLSGLVLDEKKFVTYKSACSLLNVTCKQSKYFLKKLLDRNPHLESTWLIFGIEKDSSKLKYLLATRDKLKATRSRFSSVKKEYVYSLRVKPDNKEQLWKNTQDISEMHYKNDLHLLQNLWLDRDNFMSDQIMLDHRYSSISGLPIKRTNVHRSHILLSPERKKRTSITGLGKGNLFPKKEKKQDLTRKRISSGRNLPQKKRSKRNLIASMFAKKKEIRQPALDNKNTMEIKAGKKVEDHTESSTPAMFTNKKNGLLGFFSTATKSNPFDDFKKQKSNRFRTKPKVTKARKISRKKKALKKKRRKVTKPKRPAPKKRQEEGQESEHENENGLFKRNKAKKSKLSDSDSDSEGVIPLGAAFGRSQVQPVQESGDEIPIKVSAKDRRVLLKAQEEKRKQEVLASRRVNFWGAAGENSVRLKESKR